MTWISEEEPPEPGAGRFYYTTRQPEIAPLVKIDMPDRESCPAMSYAYMPSSEIQAAERAPRGDNKRAIETAAEIAEAGALASPVLPGITRRAVMQLAAEDGIATSVRGLDINDVLGADEVFLTNSSWGVLPVRAIEREQVGDGAVGPVTTQLREAWLACVERETTAGVA